MLQKKKHRVISNSSAETERYGFQLGQKLKNGAILAFFGDLGAGKTTFIKGLVNAITGTSARNINSPTFTYLNIYSGAHAIYHFDLYRLPNAEEFCKAGFEEFLHADGICCIEWAEKIKHLLPADKLQVSLQHLGPNKRKIVIE